MRLRASASVAFALVAYTLARDARAEPSLPVQLRWSAPEACPDTGSVLAELARITRVRPGRTLPPLEGLGSVTRKRDGYRLWLEVRQGAHVRVSTFDSPTCETLSGAAALVLVLAWGDGVLSPVTEQDAPTGHRPAHAVEAPAPELVTAKPTKDTSPPRARDSRAQPRLDYTPWLGASIGSGVTGVSAIGFDFGLAAGGKHWAAFVRASLVPWQTAAVRGTVSVELQSAMGSGGGCGRVGVLGALLDVCLAFELGQIRARSRGSVEDGAAQSIFFSATPSASFLVPLAGRLALRAEAALALPFASPRYDVEPYGTLYAASRVAPRAVLGLAVEL